MPPLKYILHTFTHYPPLHLTRSQIDHDTPTVLTAGELQQFRTSWFSGIEPVLKHLSQPTQVSVLLAAFHGPAHGQSEQLAAPEWVTSGHLWRLVEDIAELFPRVVFETLMTTVAETAGREQGCVRRNAWIRKRLRKDVKACETAVGSMRGVVVAKIVESERTERDQRLLALDHVLQYVLRDLKTLVRCLMRWE